VRTITISVTQDDLDSAWREARQGSTIYEYGAKCPVARAANRALDRKVWVTEQSIMADPEFPGVTLAMLPQIARRAIRKFDHEIGDIYALRTQIEPFTFKIEVAE
jgi:hypothetical protein